MISFPKTTYHPATYSHDFRNWNHTGVETTYVSTSRIYLSSQPLENLMPRIRKEARAITHKFPFKETNQDSRYWTKNLRKQHTKIHTYLPVVNEDGSVFLGPKHRKKKQIIPPVKQNTKSYTSQCSRCVLFSLRLVHVWSSSTACLPQEDRLQIFPAP